MMCLSIAAINTQRLTGDYAVHLKISPFGYKVYFLYHESKSFIDGGHQGFLRKQTINRTDDDLRHQCRNMVLEGR